MSFSDASILEDLERLHIHLWGKGRVNVVSVAGKSYSTIDLTLFDVLLSSCPESTLLIRDEYRLAYDTILADTLKKTARQHKSAFLVTGQPGIGKTLFLLYVLARRLQEREPVAFQINSKQFALFDQSGVNLHSSETGRAPTGVWALSDSSAQHHGICDAFQYRRVHVIHTSLPASRRWRRWVKEFSAIRYVMDVWSLEELRTLLTIYNLDVHRGVALFRKFGPSPRIIDILLNLIMEDQYLSDVQTSAVKFASQFSTIFQDIESLDFSSDISSMIFTVRPVISNSRQPGLYIPTAFLSSTLGVAMARQAAAQQRTFFNMLSGHSSLHSAARWLFKNYAHIYFSDPNRNPLQAYARNNTGLDPIDPIPAPAEIIQGSTLKTIQPNHDFYWRPREPTFEGVDAVICAGGIVWALQFTIIASHRSATDGLTKVYKLMNHQTKAEWRLVIVSPIMCEAESARDLQRLTSRWRGTPVYACELPFGEFTKDGVQRLQDSLDEANDTYPTDQRADLDV